MHGGRHSSWPHFWCWRVVAGRQTHQRRGLRSREFHLATETSTKQLLPLRAPRPVSARTSRSWSIPEARSCGGCSPSQTAHSRKSRTVHVGRTRSISVPSTPHCSLSLVITRRRRRNRCRQKGTVSTQSRSCRTSVHRQVLHNRSCCISAVMTGPYGQPPVIAPAQEIHLIRRTRGRTNAAHCICASPRARTSGRVRRLSSPAAWDTEPTRSSCAIPRHWSRPPF